MSSKASILWLPGWYPSKANFLNGDFTDRHANAVSTQVNVTVLYVVKDPLLAANKSYVEIEKAGGLTIYRGYYNNNSSWAVLGKLRSVRLHFKLLFQLYKKATKEQGPFQLLHVHISLRQGLLAQWVKWKHKIPYVITEQNSWFMPVGNQYYPRSPLLQQIVQSNFKNAAAVHTVSASLGEALQQKFPFIKRFTVIPNVVDTELFFPTARSSPSGNTHFFSITSDLYHKNTDGILRAFALYLEAGNKGTLEIAGPNYEPLLVLAKQLALQDSVQFLGAVPYTTVAQKMQSADALIFFTRYETFGCVLAESLCCGTPVIASKIPVLQENLVENENALLVESENEADLAKKMEDFSARKQLFSREAIAAKARVKYGYKKIANDFISFYQAVVPGL